MAWGDFVWHTPQQNSSALNGTALTLAANVPAGHVIFVHLGFDNETATTPTVSSLGRPSGESATWTRLHFHDSAVAGARAGTRGELWAIHTTQQWNNGFGISVSFSSNTGKRASVGVSASGGVTSVRAAGSGTSTGGSPSATLSAPAVAGDLVIGSGTGENNSPVTGDTDTTNGAWSDYTISQARINTTGQGGNANVTVVIQYKVPTGDGTQTYNASTSSDSGAIVVALESGAAVPDAAGDDTTHSHTADHAALTQTHQLAVGGATHAHAADPAVLVTVTDLVVDGAAHAHAADVAGLGVVWSLPVGSAGHAHTADGAALIQQHNLGVDAAAHGHAAAGVEFDVAASLTVAGAALGHAADPADLSTIGDLVVADTDHGHAAAVVDLGQTHLIAVDDATHAAMSDTVGMSAEGELPISPATHAHTAGPANLTQTHQLSLIGTTHNHTALTVGVTQSNTLVVNDATHLQITDSMIVNQVIGGNPTMTGRYFSAAIPPWELQRGFDNTEANSDVIRHVTLWWYRITSSTDGSIELIVDPVWFDRKTDLQAAGITVMMLVHNHIDLGSGYSWNRDHLMAILENPTARANNITQIVNEAVARGFDGIEIDYENLRGDLGDDDTLATFLEELSPVAHQAGLRLEVAPPNRTSDAGPHPHHTAWDYERIHPHVDSMRIMTYEYSGSWTGPGPIGPHPWVEQGIQYALTKGVPPEKIAIAVHFWAVDWNTTAGTTTSPLWEAVDALITTHNPTINWHATHRESWFTYVDGNGDNHEVWFASPESIADRGELANRYDIGSVFSWHQGGENPAFYPAIETSFLTATPPAPTFDVTHVGHTSHALFGATNTVGVPFGTMPDDLLLLVISANFDNGHTLDEPGWTLEHETLQGVDGHTLRVYSRRAGASEPASYGVTWSTEQWHHAALHTWRNVTSVGSTDAATSTTGTAVFPALTAGPKDVAFLAASTAANGTRTVTNPEPSEIYADHNRGVLTASAVPTGGETPTSTFTIDTTSSSLSVIAAAMVLHAASVTFNLNVTVLAPRLIHGKPQPLTALHGSPAALFTTQPPQSPTF